MRKTTTFGARSTADQVLAGIDLSGKHILVTECDSDIGFETVGALAANGAHVIAAARTLQDAARVCREVGYHCSALPCDLGDLNSVAAAGAAVRELRLSLDAIVANSGITDIPSPRFGIGESALEEHFSVNHIGHFALVNDLSGLLRDAAGRVVIVSGGRAGQHGPVLYARELARRLNARGIAVNAVSPGIVRGMRLTQMGLVGRLAHYAALPFLRTPAQGAATIVLLAASPSVAAISGEYWQNCAVARAHPPLDDGTLAVRLWNTCESALARHRDSRARGLAQAA